MHKGFFEDTLSLRPELFRAMTQANCLPAAWPPSSLPSASDGLASLLWKRERGRLFLRSFLPARTTFWDFADEIRRLALLPPPLLHRLGLVFGVAAHASAMARLVLHADVLSLRESLGEELYHYALYRGQYQLGAVAGLFSRHDTDLPLAGRAHLHGRQALALCVASWPEALRMELADQEVLAEPVPAWLEQEPNALRVLWAGLKKILLTEVAPSWAPCFD